jgi:hypothetical protein
MKRTIPLLLAVVVVASCDDEPKKVATVPTAPAVMPVVAAQASQAAITGGSTICRVYVTERDVAKADLDKTPTDTLVQARVKSLDALVKETCN